MSSPTTFDAFHTRLMSAWTATPVRFENELCQDLLDVNTPAFVYVEVAGSTYDQETMGAPQQNMWIERGITWLHVMVPVGQGSRIARNYANQLLNLFREQAIDTLFMPSMSIGEGAPGRDFPNYYAMTATIEWQRRDITSLS